VVISRELYSLLKLGYSIVLVTNIMYFA